MTNFFFQQNVVHWMLECNASTQQCKCEWVDLFVLTERNIGDKRTTITSKSEDKRLLRHSHTLQMLCRLIYTLQSMGEWSMSVPLFLLFLWFYWVLCYLACVCKIALPLSLVHWLLLYAQITIRPHPKMQDSSFCFCFFAPS